MKLVPMILLAAYVIFSTWAAGTLASQRDEAVSLGKEAVALGFKAKAMLEESIDLIDKWRARAEACEARLGYRPTL